MLSFSCYSSSCFIRLFHLLVSSICSYFFHLFFSLIFSAPLSLIIFKIYLFFFLKKKSKPKSNKKKAFFYILTQKKVAEEEKFDGNLRHIVKNIFNIPYIVSNHEIGEKKFKIPWLFHEHPSTLLSFFPMDQYTPIFFLS